MKKIDFDNDSIKKNILQAALPMLAAQILSLLYNIVDRIYICLLYTSTMHAAFVFQTRICSLALYHKGNFLKTAKVALARIHNFYSI